MKWLILLIFFAGCAHKQIPVKPPEFPPVGEKLMQQCPDLLPAPDSELLSDLIKSVIKNYGEYHKCKATVEAWQQWYDEQKNNQEKVQK